MIEKLKNKTYNFLRWTEKWTKTDMIYLAKGNFWLTLGQGVSSLSALILAIAFANLLPAQTYGIYKYILSTLSIITIPTLSGINTSVTQAISRGYEGSLIPAFKTKLKWGILSSVVSVFIAFYYFINSNYILTISFLIIAIFVPIMESVSIYNSLLNGKRLFKHSTLYYIISRITSLITLIITIFLTNNLILILLAYFLPWTISRVILFLIITKKFQENNRQEDQTISYGKHLSLINITSNISSYLDTLLLFHYIGAIEVAIYSFALAPIDQVSSLLKNTSTLALPKLSNRNVKEIDTNLNSRLLKLFSIGLLSTVIYILIAPYFFGIFFPQYLNSVFISQLIAIMIAIRLPSSFLNVAVQSKLNITPKKWLYWRTLPHFIFIGILFVTIPIYGIVGAVISRIIFLLSTFMLYFIQWKLLLKNNYEK